MGLQNSTIFILGTSKFDGPDQSTSFNIARQLSKNNSVYYVDYPITWKDCFKLRGTSQIKMRRSHFSPFSNGLIKTDLENLKVLISPPLLSINFLPEGALYRSLLRVNEMLIRWRITKIIRQKKIKDFIYVNSFNFHYPGVADTLNPSLSVYHCVDPMIMPYDINHGIISENELVKKSDLVICTSRMLCNEKKQLNDNTHFIPNAADISHSIKARDSNLPLNKHLNGLKKPIIGYAGSIERRFDYTLLKGVIDNNRDKTFVFAGPLAIDYVPDWFYKTDNVILTGRLPFNDMPGLIKGFDIAIIPFKKDEVSPTIFPLKLFEYLGAGKPVIATDFNPDLEEFTNGCVTFCPDASSFSAAIEKELHNDNEVSKQKRIDTAKQNTWEKRGEEISDLIYQNLIKKVNV